jgi:hypothetical protein
MILKSMIVILILFHIKLINSLKSHLFYSSDGEIGAENYSYYYLDELGDYRIELISFDGDADLYISDTNTKTNYRDYKWQSITYGEDEVILRNTVKRPITIAVYGHPYYPSSKYRLNVYLIQKDPNNFEEYTYADFVKEYSNYDDFVQQYSNYNDFVVNEENQKRADDRDAKMKSDNDARSKKSKSNQKSSEKREKQNGFKDNNDEESLLQKIVVGILKLLAEIILN